MNPNLEPTPGQIAAETRLGYDVETSRRRVLERLNADMDRLLNVVPAMASEVSQALDAAAAANEKAEALFNSRKTILTGIEAQVRALGFVRSNICAVKSLMFDSHAAQQMADTVLGNFLLKQTNDSPEISSGFAGGLQNLAHLQALQPFLPPFIATLETKAAKLVTEIRAGAKANKINLARLVQGLRDGAKAVTETGTVKDERLHLFFEQGFLNDLSN